MSQETCWGGFRAGGHTRMVLAPARTTAQPLSCRLALEILSEKGHPMADELQRVSARLSPTPSWALCPGTGQAGPRPTTYYLLPLCAGWRGCPPALCAKGHPPDRAGDGAGGPRKSPHPTAVLPLTLERVGGVFCIAHQGPLLGGAGQVLCPPWPGNLQLL